MNQVQSGINVCYSIHGGFVNVIAYSSVTNIVVKDVVTRTVFYTFTIYGMTEDRGKYQTEL